MYFTQDKITEIFYLTDEFCLEFQKSIQGHLLGNPSKKKPKMSQSEVISILIIFHGMQHKNLKHFYINYVQIHLKNLFPNTVSYNRFVELSQQVILPMTMFLKLQCLGECTIIPPKYRTTD
jgi:hypothetical protein